MGFKGGHYNVIVDTSEEFQLSCPSCRDLGIDFHRLLKQTKENLRIIKKEVLNLANKFADFESAFNEFKFPSKRNGKPKLNLAGDGGDKMIDQSPSLPVEIATIITDEINNHGDLPLLKMWIKTVRL